MDNLEPLPIVIRLYPNRRLCDGKAGRYCSLNELRAWKLRQLPLAIVASATFDDVTDRILTEISS